MNKAICVLVFCLLSCHCCWAQNKKNQLEDEKIALQFFMDSIYPVRPILKDKILYADGKVWRGTYPMFVRLIPYYRNIVELYKQDKEYKYKYKITRIIKQKKRRFKLQKWGLIRKNEDCYRRHGDVHKEHKKTRFPPSGFLNIHSMFYDSTQTEKLVCIDILINGFSQDYGWANYTFVIKDKKIIYWRWREEEKSRSY